MNFEHQTIAIGGDTPGARSELSIFRLGPPDAATKIYLQAALHADESPGTMVLHHLLPLLRAADDRGALNARFVLLPMVNPLGLANLSLRHHIGRYDIASGVNYNRRWPDLFSAIRSTIAGRLSDDPEFNVGLVRRTVLHWIDSQQPRTIAEELRLLVLREAHDADLILDLHCDSDSLVHIFTSPELMPALSDLADWIGAAATLTATDSGGGSFDEVFPLLYRRLAAVNPTVPLPFATASATLEYRGQADTSDALGEEDARRLYGFLAGRGLVDADPGPRPDPAPAATPFEATEVVRVPRAGLVAYRVELGETVSAGQPVADLIVLDGPGAFVERLPIRATTSGLVLTRALLKYAPRGSNIMKIVGTEPLPGRKGGYLLED